MPVEHGAGMMPASLAAPVHTIGEVPVVHCFTDHLHVSTLTVLPLPALVVNTQSGYKIHDRILRAAKVIVYQE